MSLGHQAKTSEMWPIEYGIVQGAYPSQINAQDRSFPAIARRTRRNHTDVQMRKRAVHVATMLDPRRTAHRLPDGVSSTDSLLVIVSASLSYGLNQSGCLFHYQATNDSEGCEGT